MKEKRMKMLLSCTFLKYIGKTFFIMFYRLRQSGVVWVSMYVPSRKIINLWPIIHTTFDSEKSFALEKFLWENLLLIDAVLIHRNGKDTCVILSFDIVCLKDNEMKLKVSNICRVFFEMSVISNLVGNISYNKYI